MLVFYFMVDVKIAKEPNQATPSEKMIIWQYVQGLIYYQGNSLKTIKLVHGPLSILAF